MPGRTLSAGLTISVPPLSSFFLPFSVSVYCSRHGSVVKAMTPIERHVVDSAETYE